MKRALSPLARAHQPRHTASTRFVFDDLSDEIVLHVFSYLSATDLCQLESTNSTWARLALDNQLWKALYIAEYGRSRLRGGTGFVARADGREVRPLPGRAKAHPAPVKDWKFMFRISTNWARGRCALETLSNEAESDEAAPHIVLCDNFTIVALSNTMIEPIVNVHSPGHEAHIISCPSAHLNTPACITALAVDQAPTTSSHTRLATFLSTGEFSVHSLSHSYPLSIARVQRYVPRSANSRNSPIVRAAYHHPLLLTLSSAFRLSIYDLSSPTPTHVQTLTSFTSYHPSSLVLSCPTPDTYRAVLAYTAAVYPSHWSAGATELVITSSLSPSGLHSFSVSASRTTTALDVPQGFIDEQKCAILREQWARKLMHVGAAQTDGKWLVLGAGADPALLAAHSAVIDHAREGEAGHTRLGGSMMHSASTLQLYRLHFPPPTVRGTPKLSFVRSLHGPNGPVAALALADGRCVSLGLDGGIWVWDLERGTEGACVAEGGIVRALGGGEVVFDERRAVSTGDGGVLVRRFDI